MVKHEFFGKERKVYLTGYNKQLYEKYSLFEQKLKVHPSSQDRGWAQAALLASALYFYTVDNLHHLIFTSTDNHQENVVVYTSHHIWLLVTMLSQSSTLWEVCHKRQSHIIYAISMCWISAWSAMESVMNHGLLSNNGQLGSYGYKMLLMTSECKHMRMWALLSVV